MGEYTKLRVWQHARDIGIRVSAIVARLSASDRARIGDQLVRAVDSIRFNIAEGCGLNSDAQFARHLLIALGSANEAQDELEVLAESGALADDELRLRDDMRALRSMLAVLHKRVAGTKAPSSRLRSPHR